MTATAVDINIYNKEKLLRAYPVAASTTIYQGSFVALNSSGYLVSATNSYAARFVGVASEGVDNSSGANAAKYCKVYTGNSNLFRVITSGATINDVGRPMYLTDNQTVQFASSNMFVGYCAEYVSATAVYVDIEPALWDESSVESLPVAATTTITAGTMVCLSGGYVVPAANTATYVFRGVAMTGADNSAGSAGDLSVLVKSKGTFSFTASGLGATDAKSHVWVSNSTTVTTTPGLVYAGTLSRYVSATSAPVTIDNAASEPWTGAAANQIARGRYFLINAYYPTAIANNTVTIVDDFEMPVAFRVLRGYVTCSAAPSSSYVATVTITDGSSPKTVTVTGAATKGETENINQTYAADANIDITIAGDNASNAAAGFNIQFVCQEL